MAIITNLANVRKNRPFKPIYAKTQATAQAVKLGTTGSPAAYPTITPGMVMKYSALNTVVPCTNTVTDKPAGFCGTFSSELDIEGSKDMAMWVLGSDAKFYTETIDTTATWNSVAIDAPLYSNANGLLTPTASEGAIPAARFMGMAGTAAIYIAGCL